MNYDYYTSNNNGQDDYGLKSINGQGYGMICKNYKLEFPPQHQDSQPGMEYLMNPRPLFDNPYYRAAGKLVRKSSNCNRRRFRNRKSCFNWICKRRSICCDCLL